MTAKKAAPKPPAKKATPKPPAKKTAAKKETPKPVEPTTKKASGRTPRAAKVEVTKVIGGKMYTISQEHGRRLKH